MFVRKTRVLLRVASLFAACISVHAVHATTLHVSPSGSQTAPFDSWGTASRDIQLAVDTAESGDTILVGSGTYSSAEEIRIQRKDLTVRGVSGAGSTIISGGNTHRCFWLGFSKVTLDGLTIRDGSVGADSGGGLYARYGNYSILNCVITANRSDAWSGGVQLTGGTNRVDNCTINGNWSEDGPGGIEARYSADTLIVNCTIANNTAGYDHYGNGGGILAQDGAVVRNCSITGNWAGDSCGADTCVAPAVTGLPRSTQSNGSRVVEA